MKKLLVITQRWHSICHRHSLIHVVIPTAAPIHIQQICLQGGLLFLVYEILHVSARSCDKPFGLICLAWVLQCQDICFFVIFLSLKAYVPTPVLLFSNIELSTPSIFLTQKLFLKRKGKMWCLFQDKLFVLYF